MHREVHIMQNIGAKRNLNGNLSLKHADMLSHWTCYCNRKHFFIVTVHETIAYFAVTVNLGMQNHNYRAMKLKHINSLSELSCPESTVKIYPMKNMSSRTLPFFKAFKFKRGFVGFYLAYHITNLYLKKTYNV